LSSLDIWLLITIIAILPPIHIDLQMYSAL
jgi:hypothetical protein